MKGESANPLLQGHRVSSRALVTGDLVKFIIKQIDKESRDRFYLVLGNPGSGKTTLALNIYYHYVRKFFKKSKIYLIPLGYADIETVLSRIPNSDKHDTTLILDAFDEDSKAHQSVNERLAQIVKLTADFKKVIITSRTQTFPDERSEPRETGILRHGFERGEHIFWKIYISPFDQNQAASYIKKRFGIFSLRKRKRALRLLGKFPEILGIPTFLSYIDQLILFTTEFKYSYQYFEFISNLWIERESYKLPSISRRSFEASMNSLLRSFAVSIYRNARNSGKANLHVDQIEELIGTSKIDISKVDLKSLSLLNRSPNGTYSFSHKSFLSYFLALEVFENDTFREEFDFSILAEVGVLYDELVQERKRLSRDAEKLGIDEVFGIRNGPIRSYIERNEIDKAFTEALQARKHVLVYGASKQGKTSLLNKHVNEGSYLKIECTPTSTLLDIYSSILRQNDVHLLEGVNIQNKESSSEMISLKAKLKIPIAEVEARGVEKSTNENKVEDSYKLVDYNISNAQDVIEVLKKISFNRFIVLENFHYLIPEVQMMLAFDLRSFQDDNINFIILGIWKERNRLSQYNGDLQDRISEIAVEPWTDRDFREIIRKGEVLLEVDFRKVENKIIDSAYGSVGVLQELCKECCKMVEVKVGRSNVLISTENLGAAIEKKLGHYSTRYLRSFQSLMSDDELATNKVLGEAFVRSVLSADLEVVTSGFKKSQLSNKVLEFAKEDQRVNDKSVSIFLKEINLYQSKKNITPPLFDFDLVTNELIITDSTLLFFLVHCDKNFVEDRIFD